MGDQSYGLVDYWLAGIRDTVRRHDFELQRIASSEERFKRVVELNVMRQVYNLSRTPVVQGAWSRGRRPLLHGLVYDIHDGLLKPIVLQVDGNDKARELLETPRASVGD
jgi:carbonic anhydrase